MSSSDWLCSCGLGQLACEVHDRQCQKQQICWCRRLIDIDALCACCSYDRQAGSQPVVGAPAFWRRGAPDFCCSAHQVPSLLCSLSLVCFAVCTAHLEDATINTVNKTGKSTVFGQSITRTTSRTAPAPYASLVQQLEAAWTWSFPHLLHAMAHGETSLGPEC